MGRQGAHVSIRVPDNAVRNGLRSLFHDSFSGLGRERWLLHQLFLRDLRSVYKQSVLGALWAVAVPALSIGVFVALGNSGVISIRRLDVPYLLWAVTGMTFWQVFATGLVAGTGSLAAVGNMIAKINLRRENLVLASFGKVVIPIGVQVLAVAVLMAAYRWTPTWWTLALPFAMLPLLLLTVGLSFLLSLVNAIARDVALLVGAVMPLLMFATPVLYPLPEGGIVRSVALANPVFHLMEAPRQAAFGLPIEHATAYWVSVAASLVTFALGLVIFNLTNAKISERV